MASQPARIHSWDEFKELFHKLKIAPKYSAVSEEKTPHPWWDLDKENIHAILKFVSETTASSTNGATGLDKELDHVMKTATQLENVKSSSTIKVALIGAQGAGKSLLINALFDCKGLSLTGANGGACTSAIVKYAYITGDKYSAEVQFLNTEMRKEMIDEHIKSYLHYHNDLDDSDDEDGPRVRSLNQDKMEEKLKKTAEDFFDTIFGSREEFLSAWSSSPVNTGEFKSLCQLKCKEAMEETDMTSDGITHISRSSPEELLTKIKPFISTVDNEACLWPIVKHVTIRHNHPLLQGLEIIDLPGSGDVNLTRARLADEIKDSVDVEMILGDTIRITTDETVISTARSGMLNHGASKVKILATKIDAISDNQLTQCSGPLYDEINTLMQQADADAALAEEEGEDAKSTQIGRYKQYLERCLKSRMIEERAKEISAKFAILLRGRSDDDQVEIMHTSTADYMLWTKNEKILFKDQPALDPEGTGVPAIRRFLFNLPAPQNLRDYSFHINTAIPAFIDKLNRVVTQSDRDAGFRTIADEFDNLRARFLKDFAALIKWHYLKYSKSSIAKIKKDVSAFKAQIENILRKWLLTKAAAFSRIMKSRGTVHQGVSRAKGLENGVNWNAELACVLQTGFRNWYAAHTEQLRDLKSALPMELARLYSLTLKMMNNSAANLVTVEKSKGKWKKHQLPMKSKLMAMMDEMLFEEKRLLQRTTLEDERENNLIASITDGIYDDVFNSLPALKATPPGKPKRYVVSKIKFQKERLEKHFLSPDAHFVDKVITTFQTQLEEKMQGLVDKHFAKLNASFDEFSTHLRDHAPVDFAINPLGESIRTELEKQIPAIEQKAKELQDLLPKTLKTEDDGTMVVDEVAERCDGQVQDLTYFIETVKKRKRATGNGMARGKKEDEYHVKRMKYEE